MSLFWKEKVTVEDAYKNKVPASYKGQDVDVIEFHHKGYGPLGLGKQPDYYRVALANGNGFMVPEGTKLVKGTGFAPETVDCWAEKMELLEKIQQKNIA